MPADSEHDHPGPSAEAFPAALAEGTTALLCGFDPTEYLVALRCLARFGDGADSAVVVSTTHGVEDTIGAYSMLGDPSTQPSLSVVDMVSEG